MSLRAQIFVWYAVAISLLIVGLAFAAQSVIEQHFEATIDDGLRDRTDLLSAAILANPGISRGAYDALIEWVTEQKLSDIPAVLRISDPAGNVLASFGEVPNAMVPIMDQQLLLSDAREDKGQFETVRMRGHKALRLYTVAVADPSDNHPIVILQTGDSLGQIVAARGELWVYTLSIGIGGSAVALLVGFIILQRGLRPLDRILRRVEEVESTNLATRIPTEPRPPELKRLAETLNTMLARINAAFRAREAFVCSVSHDLKTPLAILQTQIEIMLMQSALDQDTRNNLNRMAKEVRRLSRMTNNLLLSAQLEFGPTFTPTEVNLGELVREVVAEARFLAEGLTVNVSAPEIVMIAGDYDLLKQMLLNVVENALKFTPRGGVVNLYLSEDSTYAVIRVSDTGQGMSPEYLSNIGQPFYRSDSGPRSGRGGMGLGLYIVKKIIDLHRGRLDIQSQSELGTTVILQIPLHYADDCMPIPL